MAGRRILIVAERAANSGELEARLGGLGYEVVAATSGDDALTAAAGSAPELLLVLVEPGDVSGVTAAHAIGRLLSIPVVWIGAQTDETAALLRRVGLPDPNDFLAPPFADRELRAYIELALCRESAARTRYELGRFFDVSIDLFCFLDFNGYFKRLNPAWEQTLGFSREELMSRRFIEFVHPDDRERTLDQNARVRDGGKAMGFENRYLNKDGSYRWLLWNAAPQSDERMIYGIARDITARKQAEEEREQLVRKLEASRAEVESLQDIVPICLYCRRIRDDEDYWQTVESYVSLHTRRQVSHGICPSCMATEVEPALEEFERE